MLEYYILTLDPNMGQVFGFIELHDLQFEMHLNRTRFWIDPDSALYTEFCLRYSHCCPPVDPTLDLATGRKL
jgi:hypothetical protein